MSLARIVRRRTPTPVVTSNRPGRRVRAMAPGEIDFNREAAQALSNVLSLQAQAATLATELAAAEASLMAKMKRGKLVEIGVQGHVATIERAAGRTSNVVDPKKFRSLVKDDNEFFGAITVSMTEAKKLLPEKTLGRITTSTPGKAGEEKIKIVQLKVKVK